MKNDVRKLTEGAMMVGLIGIVLFLNRQSAGILESSLYWLLSFPILIYSARFGLTWGCITFISMMLLSLIISTPQSLFYLFSALVVGLVYGVGVRKKWSNQVLLVVTTIFTFFSYVVTMFVLASIFGYNIKDEILTYVELLNQMQINLVIPQEKIAFIFVWLFIFVLVLLQSLCTHLIGRILLSRFKIETRPMKNIFMIHLNKGIGVSAILIFLAQMGTAYFVVNEIVASILMIASALMLFLYVGYGLSVMLCFLVSHSLSKYGWLLAILVLIPPLWIFIAALGIWDSFKDLKKIMREGVMNGSSRKL